MNGLTRFKWALTENNPTIKPYFEDRWSLLSDNLESNIEFSYSIIRGVHNRWVHLMKQMKESDWERTFIHPEDDIQYTLSQYLANYSWHCDHHLAHIEQGIESQGNFN